MGKKGESPPLRDGPEPPGTMEKNHKNADLPMREKSEIAHMRTRLIKELKTPFIERVTTAPSFSHIKEVKMENFDERVMTLSDREIFELYTEYEKIGTLPDKKEKEMVRNSILDRLASSILSNGHFLRRILRRKNP